MPNRHHSSEGVAYFIPTLCPHKTTASMLKSQIFCFHSPPSPLGDEMPSGEGLHSALGDKWAHVHASTGVTMQSLRSWMVVDPITRVPLLSTVSGSMSKSLADCRSTSCTSSNSRPKIWLQNLPESNVTFKHATLASNSPAPE